MFDRNRLTIRPLSERKSKTSFFSHPRLADCRSPSGEIWSPLLVCDEAVDNLDSAEEKFVDRIVIDIKKKKKVILGFGAHFIKNKCHPYLKRMMDKGYVTHVVTNGASTIHDFEFVYDGKTEEDVRENLANGTFGLWDTGHYINAALRFYGHEGYGYGLGKYLETNHSDKPYGISFVWQCYNRDIPLSICTSIGHDIIYEHPRCDGAKIGEASYIDFLKLAETLEGLTDAVVLCVGSAVTVPMVMEKAFAMAKNVAPLTGRNVCCYVIDLFDEVDDWKNRGDTEPGKSDVSYFIRPLKTFNRMFPDRCKYKRMDNRKLMFHLWDKLEETEKKNE